MQNLVTNIYVLLMPSLKVSHMQVLQNLYTLLSSETQLNEDYKGKKSG